MPIRIKLILGFGILVALTAALATFAVQRVTSLGTMVVQVYDQPLMSISHARSSQATFNAAVAALGKDLAKADASAKTAMANLDKAIEDVRADLAIVTERSSGDDVRAAVAGTKAAMDDWLKSVHTILDPGKGGATALPAPWVLDGKAKVASDRIDDLVQVVAARGFEFRTAAEAQIKSSQAMLTWSAGAAAGLGLLLALLFARLLGSPIVQMRRGVEAMLRGETVALRAVRRRDEIGDLARSFTAIHETAVTAARIRSALDGSSTNVLAADTQGRVVYANQAAARLFKDHVSDFRSAAPGFNPDAVIGGRLDDVLPHGRSDARSSLDGVQSSQRARFVMGSRTLDVVASPVVDGAGERLGVVVEITDATQRLAAERELSEVTTAMAAAAMSGDFSSRVSLEGKSGLLRDVASAVNEIGSVVETLTDDLTEALGAIAEGNLTRGIDRAYSGRFKVLADAVNGTIARLAQTIETIKSAADHATASATEIGSGAQDLSMRTEQQSAALEETAATIEELAASIKATAANSRNVVSLSEDATSKAAKGGDIVTSAIEAMARIEAASGKISQITSVIDEIAFQTNLLALNAAVEAARAGDAGKGFAVVASEVRTLAQRSSEAAKDITQVIQSSAQLVREGVDLVKSTGATLGEIVKASRDVAATVAEIATAAGEQASGIDEMSQAMSDMDGMTQQNAALAEESAASATALSQQVNQLNDLVAAFRTGNAERRPAARQTLRRSAA
jgi:methyl-accepting chemotaxis protein